MANTVSTPAELATRYLQAWNEADPRRRRALVGEVFSEDASYVDPLAAVAGHEGVDALIAGMQAKFAGARFAVRGTPEGHHDRIRFSWTLDSADGKLAEGTDIAVLADDGRLRGVTGFLDYVAPGLA